MRFPWRRRGNTPVDVISAIGTAMTTNAQQMKGITTMPTQEQIDQAKKILADANIDPEDFAPTGLPDQQDTTVGPFGVPTNPATSTSEVQSDGTPPLAGASDTDVRDPNSGDLLRPGIPASQRPADPTAGVQDPGTPLATPPGEPDPDTAPEVTLDSLDARLRVLETRMADGAPA